LLPIVGVLWNVRGIIELVELGRIFRDEAVGLDEIGEYVAARPVPSNTPFDVEAILLDAAGPPHQSVDIRQLIGHVIERGPVVAEDRHAVVIRAATQEVHEMRAVGELEAENVDKERNLIFNARAVEDDMADLGRPRAIQNDAWMLRAIR